MHGIKTIKNLNDTKAANAAAHAAQSQPKSVFGPSGKPPTKAE